MHRVQVSVPRRTLVLFTLALVGLAQPWAMADDEGFVAGVEPSRRPDGAPKQTVVVKDAAWYRHALTGISQPYPASLRFLEDQGNWYSPFLRPGMTGPYDIRNWHQPATAGGGQDANRR